ncbi:MAG: sensor histidine kinase [Actinoallomurus sp.]
MPQEGLRIAYPGPGTAADDLSRIFERRFQGGSDSDRGGAGLGLAIAQEITHAHGGTITADSTPGHGTTAVTVTLPRSAVEALALSHT